MADDDGVDPFEPCTLGRSQDGDPNVFFKKVNGAGANDLCMMQELTRDSILGNLSDRFAVRVPPTHTPLLLLPSVTQPPIQKYPVARTPTRPGLTNGTVM